MGDRPLLTDQLFPSGEHRLRSALVPELSTLAQTPAFPVLLANVVDWRLDHEPGLRRANWRQGESVRIAVPAERCGMGIDRTRRREDASGTADAGATWALKFRRRKRGRGLAVAGSWKPGIGALRFCKDVSRLRIPRVNLCSAAASDLRLCATAQAGSWPESLALEGRFKMSFILILLALGLLALHGHLSRKGAEQ